MAPGRARARVISRLVRTDTSLTAPIQWIARAREDALFLKVQGPLGPELHQLYSGFLLGFYLYSSSSCPNIRLFYWEDF